MFENAMIFDHVYIWVASGAGKNSYMRPWTLLPLLLLMAGDLFNAMVCLGQYNNVFVS